jgi:adenylate cyclase
LAALKAHRRELIDPKISEYAGRIVKTTGDGLLLEFPSVVDAVRCAVDVQRGMAERNASAPADQRIDFRIGINVGDIIIDGDDIYGDGVNVGSAQAHKRVTDSDRLQNDLRRARRGGSFNR